MTCLGAVLGVLVAAAVVCWASTPAAAAAALICLRVLRWFGVDERLYRDRRDGPPGD